MRAGLVGTVLNYRPQNIKGAKFGIIDVMFQGDTSYPSETSPILVLNQNFCALLIKTLATTRDPLITMVCWINREAKEITLLDILSIEERVYDSGGALATNS